MTPILSITYNPITITSNKILAIGFFNILSTVAVLPTYHHFLPSRLATTPSNSIHHNGIESRTAKTDIGNNVNIIKFIKTPKFEPSHRHLES